MILAMLAGLALAADDAAAAAGPPPGAPAPAVGAAVNAGGGNPAARAAQQSFALATQMLMGRGWITPNADSEKLWNQLLTQFQTLTTERWKMFALQAAATPDQKAIRGQMAVVMAIMKQMGDAATAMQPYYHATAPQRRVGPARPLAQPRVRFRRRPSCRLRQLRRSSRRRLGSSVALTPRGGPQCADQERRSRAGVGLLFAA